MTSRRVSLLRKAQFSVEWYPWLARDGHNQDTYSPMQVLKVYPEGKATVVTNREGKDVVSQSQLYVDGTYELTIDDKFVYQGANHFVSALAAFYVGTERAYWVVYL